jgi:sirohydrochlorin cobaltochelatase
VPAAVADALARRGRQDIEQVQAAHLGCHAAMVELSKSRADDALSAIQRGGASGYCGPREDPGTENREDPGTENACLLLIGRGSHDESATAEMHEFAGLRRQGIPGKKVKVAFLAMARPLLAEQLPVIARQGYRRVIVQPHLLFRGELVDSIERQVAEAKGQFPKTEWIVAQALADLPGKSSSATKLLEKVILDHCQEAGIHVVAAEADD